MRRLILSRLIWIYFVCKSLLFAPVAVEELKGIDALSSEAVLSYLFAFFLKKKKKKKKKQSNNLLKKENTFRLF